jgi:spore maturation protein CgeB
LRYYYKFKFCLFSLLKKINFVNKLNAVLKAFITVRKRNRLLRMYRNLANKRKIVYSRAVTVETFKSQINFESRRKLRIFWVGTDESQDRSGFLQALNRIFDVYTFVNANGKYGLMRNTEMLSQESVNRLRISNGKALVDQLEQQIKDLGSFDILLGQMLGNNIANSALEYVKNKGIKVINISMDDRLPELWGKLGNIRLGSIGLARQLDLVLTTSPETCEWYAVENCPAIYWPLGSDYSIFGSQNFNDRDIDVLFIGNRYGIRGQLIDYLKENDIEVKCYGAGWLNGFADVEMMRELSKRAKIILGIGTVAYTSNVYTLKLRDFDAPMSGAMYLTHRNNDLCELFVEGLEIECYDSFEEAKNKIKYYLSNEDARLAIAKNGHSKALMSYNWDKRLRDTFLELGILNSSSGWVS